MKSRLILTAVVASGLLLGLVPGAQAELRVGKNFRLLSDTNAFRSKDQVGLAVNPNNPQHIVQTNANYYTENCEATFSLDGGDTWSPAVPLQPPAVSPDPFLPSCRISNHLGETMFQTVAFGTGQNVYATSIVPRACPACPAGSNGETGSYVLVYKSTNGGQTWGPGVAAIPGGPASNTGPYHELPSIAVEPGAGAGGADRVYAVARETTAFREAGGDVATAFSNDGGLTFTAPVYADPLGETVAGPDGASNPVIGSDGSVYVAWRVAGTAGSVRVARSTDQAATWTPVTATNVTAGGHPSSSHVTPLPSTGSTFPRLAIHRTGNATTDRLYLVYNQGTPPGPTTCGAGCYTGADHFIHDDTDVYFQRSLTNGDLWSTPKVINDLTPRPGQVTTQTRHPSISVAPNGRVDIVWQDRRHWYQGPGERNCVHTHLACDDTRLGDTYYAFSNDGGSNFSPTGGRRITDRSHNNDVGVDYRFGSYWAFGPVSVPLGNDQLLVGWMDTREGSFDNDNHDIYLAKVNHNAPASVPQEEVTPPDDPPTLSASLGVLGYPGGGEAIMGGNFINRNATRPVIVNKDDFSLALAAGVLARANLSPVLLSPPGGLPASVKAEVSRLNPAGAYVIGDEGRLSSQVISDLAAAGVPNDANQIVRLSAGADDAGTARLIAQPLDRRSAAEKAANTPPAFDAAVIVNPASPDAAAASALAAARRLPILFVTADSIPSATSAALGTNEFDINKTLVIGNDQVIGNAVMGQLPNPTRLGGSDQYETSKAVVTESIVRGMAPNIAYVADGSSPMDGALLGPVVGRATGLMLLSPDGSGASAESTLGGMGLTGGLDRIIALRPTPGGGGTGPPGGPGGGPTAGGGTTPSIPGVPPTGDTDPLLLELGGRSTQRLRVIRITAMTNKDASLQAGGTIAGPRTTARLTVAQRKRRKAKTFRLPTVRRDVSARTRVTLRFRVSRKAVKAIKARLRRGRRGTARISVAATDRAGNKRTATRTVRIKR